MLLEELLEYGYIREEATLIPELCLKTIFTSPGRTYTLLFPSPSDARVIIPSLITSLSRHTKVKQIALSTLLLENDSCILVQTNIDLPRATPDYLYVYHPHSIENIEKLSEYINRVQIYWVLEE